MKTNIEKKNEINPIESVLRVAIDSILEKHGSNVISLNLTNIEDAMCDYFIICEGNSTTQVRAIADNINKEIFKQLGESAITTEGTKTYEWVLIDFFDIVIHIFRKDVRHKYGLEELWGDAAIVTRHTDDDTDQNIQQTFLSKAD